MMTQYQYIYKLQLGAEISGRMNSISLKERLLAVVPDSRSHMNGKEVLLTYDSDIGTVINFARESYFDSYAMVLAKAAKIVCREIFNCQEQL